MDALENMQVRELAPSMSCKWMKGKGTFARMGVQGDGSCFFHSVCALLNKDNYLFVSPAKQKSIAYDYRCKFTDSFTRQQYAELSSKSASPKSFETEHDGFCEPRVWADEVMIRHASKREQMNFIFLDLENNRAYCGVHGHEAEEQLQHGERVMQDTGIIAWVGHSHFEPIVRVDSAERGQLTTIFEPQDNPQDAELVAALMETYATGCSL
jgi:hypothetical protein